MPWYLPDRYPIFWEEMRRRCFGRRRTGLIIGLMLLALVPVSITLLVILWPTASKLLHPGNRFLQNIVWRAFLSLQYLLLFLFAPSLAAGVICSEREKGTLEMLLLTPVSSRALVWQKFLGVAAFVAYIPLIFAMLIPIFYVTGGVSVLVMLGGYFGLLIHLCLYVAIGVFISCLCKTTRIAILLTYVTLVVLLLMTTIGAGVLYVLFFILRHGGLSVGRGLLSQLIAFCPTVVYLLIAFFCLLLSSRHIHVLRGLARRTNNPRPALPLEQVESPPQQL